MEERKKPNLFKKVLLSYRRIPDKKPYIEFVTALLSIPVLLTVIILNLSTLRGDKDNKAPVQTTTTEKIYVTVPASGEKAIPITPQEPCTPGIGMIEISSPEENEVVTDNPVIIDINYEKGEYCEVVWSYRINGGKWSDYDDRSIALYNLPQGNIKLDLRVKSIVNSDTESITRNFIYQGSSAIPTIPTSSTSAN